MGASTFSCRPFLIGLILSIFVLPSLLVAQEEERISAAVLDRMQGLMRQGLDEHYHGAYDTARDKIMAAYVTLLTARRDELIQSHVQRVSAVFPHLTEARSRLKYVISVVGYEPMDVGVSIPISLSEIDATIGRFRTALDEVRSALKAAPDWLRAQHLGSYVGGLRDAAQWGAGSTVAGQQILASAAPYDLSS